MYVCTYGSFPLVGSEENMMVGVNQIVYACMHYASWAGSDGPLAAPYRRAPSP